MGCLTLGWRELCKLESDSVVERVWSSEINDVVLYGRCPGQAGLQDAYALAEDARIVTTQENFDDMLGIQYTGGRLMLDR
jgi:hypothetical protein